MGSSRNSGIGGKMNCFILFFLHLIIFSKTIKANDCDQSYDIDKDGSFKGCFKCDKIQCPISVFPFCTVKYDKPNSTFSLICGDGVNCAEIIPQLTNVEETANFVYESCTLPENQTLLEVAKNLGMPKVTNVRIVRPSLNAEKNARAYLNPQVFSGIEELKLKEFENWFVKEQLFQNGSNLKVLWISRSAVDISDDFFDHLGGLREIHLFKNEMSDFSLKAFDKLRDLRILDLWFTPDDEVFLEMKLENYTLKNVLKNNKQLWKIVVSHAPNLLRSMESGLFDDLESLTVVALPLNKISSVPDGPMFKSSPNLRKLDLSFNNLSILPENIFHGLKKLEHLFLGYQKGELVLPEGVFKDMENLVTLDLGYAGLRSLSQGLFDHSGRLKTLALQGNELATIPERIFNRNFELRSLNLGHQLMGSLWIPERSFANLTKLEMLDLSQNSMTSLPEELFKNNINLGHLDLSKNRLPYLTEKHLQGLTNLTNLVLKDQVNFYIFSNEIFKSLKGLKLLDLSGNGIVSLPDGLFQNNNVLKSLFLQENKLSTITRNAFTGLESLHDLHLDKNVLENIHQEAFSDLRQLEYASLKDNKLTFENCVSESPFYRNRNIKTLKLSNNKIYKIFHDWLNASKLEILDLAFNDLTELKSQDLEYVSKNMTLDVRGNPIQTINFDDIVTPPVTNKFYNGSTILKMGLDPVICNCSSFNFIRYVKMQASLSTQNEIVLYFDDVICFGPENMASKEIWEFQLNWCDESINEVKTTGKNDSEIELATEEFVKVDEIEKDEEESDTEDDGKSRLSWLSINSDTHVDQMKTWYSNYRSFVIYVVPVILILAILVVFLIEMCKLQRYVTNLLFIRQMHSREEHV